jgi:hypothetical protein
MDFGRSLGEGSGLAFAAAAKLLDQRFQRGYALRQSDDATITFDAAGAGRMKR